MQELNFIEDESITDNCKMIFTYTFPEENYVQQEGYKNDVVLKFMDLLKTDIYANEIEVVRPEFDVKNNRRILLNVTVYNGRASKKLIREILDKAQESLT